MSSSNNSLKYINKGVKYFLKNIFLLLTLLFFFRERWILDVNWKVDKASEQCLGSCDTFAIKVIRADKGPIASLSNVVNLLSR